MTDMWASHTFPPFPLQHMPPIYVKGSSWPEAVMSSDMVGATLDLGLIKEEPIGTQMLAAPRVLS